MAAGITTGVEVHEIMSHRIHSVTESTSIGEALRLMSEASISAVPVVDDSEHCVGIVTATDLVKVMQGTAQTLQSEYPHYDDCLWAIDLVQRNLAGDPVRQIMSEVMVTVSPDLSVERAAKTMVAENVHHLPVVVDRKLVGFLSSIDIARVLTGDIHHD